MNKKGYTVLIVEQQVEQVLEIVQRAYLIEASRIIEEGDTDYMRKSKKLNAAYMGI